MRSFFLQEKTFTSRLFVVILLCFFILPLTAQRKKKKSKEKPTPTLMDSRLLDIVEWREIGPFRGGRSATVAGVPHKPNLYYMGTTGGGVWQTQDGGRTWKNISDGFFGGSIGAVSVSEYDPNVIYVGGGEITVRGNVSSGYGIWKSEDAGKTWVQKGLKDSRHVSRIRIHPRDPDVVYAAVMGNLYAPNAQRGIFRSKDGGDTWEKVLFVNDEVGAIDLTFDPNNTRVLYASTWKIKRTPYSLESGGEGSGLWKSTDGGDNWENISTNEGLPTGIWGISGVTVSPVNSDRVWAIIENKKGGVFRSDDAGKTWKKLNDSRSLRQRAWYYTRIYADTHDEDVVYVMNVRYHKSTDGGKTFKAFNAPHGDHHDLWIAPENPKRMVIADDGGGQVSYDGGITWSTYHNQPTAQFYRVNTDNHFPYRIYAAQQDNSTIRISHRSSGGFITEDDWESTAGGESGHIAIDPTDNDIVYGGSYDGYLTRLNHRTGHRRAINVYPDNPMGHGAEGMKYRFQWNFPIFFSPHQKSKLYTTSQHVHVSYDEGHSWEIISPDLTRNDPSKQVSSGGPITKDNTSVEYYCTIFAAAESPIKEGVIWAGSDDGLVHITTDGGKNWTNVTPKNMPEWMMINSVEPSPFDAGEAYIAATMYKSGNFQPYIYKTKDYGKTWTKIVNGIDQEHFTRVVRADPKRKGLLYAGTETGMYISFDDGSNWQPFQLNLPVVPITDLAIKNDNLIAATQGRSLWIIDDLTPLHQMDQNLKNRQVYLYQPMPSYRMSGRGGKSSLTRGTNHPGGVMVHYFVDNLTDSTEVTLTFLEKGGKVIREFSNQAKEKSDQLKVEKGANRFIWNMRYPNAKSFDKMILWAASMNGPKAMPGDYEVQLTVDDMVQNVNFKILKDPRTESSKKEMQSQFDFLVEVRDKLTEAHEAIIEIRDIRSQLKNYTKRLTKNETTQPLLAQAEKMDSMMTVVENELYQTKNQSRQDPLNFPIKLTNKLGHLNSLVGNGDYPPTQQSVEVKNILTAAINEQLSDFEKIKSNELPKFNQMVRAAQIDAIILKQENVER
ncbi:MAG: glycosyl hydrolase [Bacteroidota bacterium]